MILETDGFDWDDGNRTSRKHGVSTAEVEEVFRGGHSSLETEALADQRSADRHRRWGLEGMYVWRLRCELAVAGNAFVPSRYMHEKEIAAYEKSEEQSTEA